MLLSELASELVKIIAEKGDKKVKISLCSENGDISFDDNITIFVFDDHVDINSDSGDIKEFKQKIKVLY